MHSQSGVPMMAIEEQDLLVVAQAITMRCHHGTAEDARAARLRTLVEVAAHLGRTLSTYARHALVNCQGTAGANDVDADTRLLTDALRAFCAEVEEVSVTYADSLPAKVRGTPETARQVTESALGTAASRFRDRSDAMAHSLPH